MKQPKRKARNNPFFPGGMFYIFIEENHPKYKLMKLLLTTAIALLSVVQVTAQGVTFIEGSWDEARQMASDQEKHILVDAFTDWCYWCKVQDKETFSREDVGQMVNEKFIPVKINFEEGIGADLAMKYRVQGYPTLLFFNPEGKLVGRTVGYNSDPEEWMKEVEGMLNTETHPPSTVDPDVLDPGFPDFFKASFTRDGERGKPADAETVSSWLDEQEDLFTEVVFNVIKMRQTNEKWNTFFMENQKQYIKMFGEEEVADKIESIFMMKGYGLMNAGDEEGLENLIVEARETVGEDLAKNMDFLKLDLYMSTGRYEEYMVLASSNFESEDGKLNDGFINSVCWNIYEGTEDEGLLTQAVEWMGRVVDTKPEYNYLDTYAALLLATHQLDEAEKWAKKAIALGQADETDTSATEELMQKIKEARAE